MNVSVCLPIALNKSFDYIAPPQIADKLRPGMRVIVPFGPSLKTGFIKELNTTPKLPPKTQLKEIKELLDSRVFFGEDLMPLASFIEGAYANTPGETLNVLLPSFINDKLLDKYTPPSTDLPLFYNAGPLTEDQKAALDLFDKYNEILLSGPFNSGKTEVSLQYAHKVLTSGGQVLVLVPDAVSSDGLIKTIEAKLGAQNIHLWHSKVPLSARKTAAADILLGRPCVVVGTRSACLLPFKNLRLSIITQEEDKTYKQEEAKPYYHAREVLAFRSDFNKGKLISISCAPSFESLKKSQEGKLKTLEFKKQIKGFDNKTLIFLAPKGGTKSKFISDGLLDALRENLLAGGQSLLVLNRLGYSGAYACLNCRAFAKCKHCGGILAREQANDRDFLVCRKCGKQDSLDQTCPVCGNSIFRSLGGGTQTLEAETARFFPQARIYRLDSQTLKNKDGQGHFVQEALEGKTADIIIGTNLSMKLDFKNNINLAALVDTDLELNTPDFRASERLAQTLLLLKGRLDAVKNAKLFLQVSRNDLFDFNFLKTNDFNLFAAPEMAFRKEFEFPPYIKLVKLIITAKTKNGLERYTKTIINAVNTAYSSFMRVAGTAQCGRASDKEFQQYILIKSLDDDMLKGFIKNMAQNKALKQVTVKIIADPYNFL